MMKTLIFVLFVVMATESVTAVIDDSTKQDIDEFIENILSCRNITGQFNSSTGLAPEINQKYYMKIASS